MPWQQLGFRMQAWVFASTMVKKYHQIWEILILNKKCGASHLSIPGGFPEKIPGISQMADGYGWNQEPKRKVRHRYLEAWWIRWFCAQKMFISWESNLSNIALLAFSWCLSSYFVRILRFCRRLISCVSFFHPGKAHSLPIGCMYTRMVYLPTLYHKNQLEVGKYTIVPWIRSG